MWPFGSKQKTDESVQSPQPSEQFNDRTKRMLADYLARTPQQPTREETNRLAAVLLKTLKKS